MRRAGAALASAAAAAVLRRGSEGLARALHRRLPAAAGLPPAVAEQRHGAVALALARVLAAHALAGAGVLAGAAMGLDGGAVAPAGAVVARFLAVALAG